MDDEGDARAVSTPASTSPPCLLDVLPHDVMLKVVHAVDESTRAVLLECSRRYRDLVREARRASSRREDSSRWASSRRDSPPDRPPTLRATDFVSSEALFAWARGRGAVLTREVRLAAAEAGSCDVAVAHLDGSPVSSLYDRVTTAWSNSLSSGVARKTRREALEMDLAVAAARGGRVDALRRFFRVGFNFDGRDLCAAAAAGGHAECLEWLRHNGMAWDSRVISCAARGGHVRVIETARREGLEWTVAACAEAAGAGRLETLQWLRARGAPWNWWTVEDAGSNGHLEVMKWALENGCDLAGEPGVKARRNGHGEDVERYLKETRPVAFMYRAS